MAQPKQIISNFLTGVATMFGLETKFAPSDANVNWPHIQTLVHGPGAPGWGTEHHGDSNSAVFASLMAIATAYPEPPLIVMRNRGGKEYPIDNHQLQQLFYKPTPNGELSMEDLLFWISWAKHTDGNAYLLKTRAIDSITGNVIQLWPISPVDIVPVTKRDRNGRARAWIDYYRLRVGPNAFEDVPVENIVHFRLGVDPLDRRLGLSPLKRLIREIATDNQASAFTDALLRNYGVPGLMVVPRGQTRISEPNAERLEQKLDHKLGGENRGKTVVFSAESEIHSFGFSPEQLKIDALHRIPEERIAAVIGVPPIVAGLGAGLDRSTFANFRESREGFTEQKLVPEWRQDAARFTVSLLPDFSSVQGVFVQFDITNVRALQEDMDSKYERLDKGVQGGWVLRNEARVEVGFDPVEGWDEEDIAPPVVPTLPEDPEDDPSDEEDEDPDNQPGQKQMRPRGQTKAVRQDLIRAKQREKERSARIAEAAFTAYFKKLSDDIIAAARRIEPEITKSNGIRLETKQMTRTQWMDLVETMFEDHDVELEQLMRRTYLDVVKRTWPILNLELGQNIRFNQNDPLVQNILAKAGTRIVGIQQTTLDELRPMLQGLYADGANVDTIAREVRKLVEETYSNRGRAIARTEVGFGQNIATTGRYAAADVQHVYVFDNGFHNSHEFCKQVDGHVVTLGWAERNPLQHPNCVRAFAAAFDYDGPVFTEEQPWN